MNAKTLTAIALLMAAVPVAGFAQGAPARPTPPTLDFAAADTDASGGISAEEWSAYATTLRDQMRAQMIGTRADALITAGDANGDGALSRDELVTAMNAQADERREAREEGRGPMDRMRSAMMRHHQDDDHGRGGWGRGGERGEMRGDRGDRREMRAEMRGERGEMRGERGSDRAEMRERMRGERSGMGFARINANGDGQIDTDELAHAQAMINWMAQRPTRG